MPAGKVNEGENDVQAILREVEEETSYKARSNELEMLGVFELRSSGYIVDFPTYRIKLKKFFKVKHRPDEHQDYKWVKKKECVNVPNLIYGLREILKKVG